jgi:branched-chain amino acid transport system ATP-binding protein
MTDAQRSAPLLKVSSLKAGYGSKRVVFDADFEVRRGEVVGIIGHNGAGKTTTLRSVCGTLKPAAGKIVYQGADIAGRSARKNVASGMSMVRSERFTFGELTVRENLLLGGLHVSGAERERRLASVFELLPVLQEREKSRASEFSGGQQRLLSIGMALVANPTLLLFDEPSLGIAPALTSRIFDTVKQLVVERGVSVLIVEQNIGQLLRIVDRVYVMRSGRTILEESAEQMKARKNFWDLF